VTPRLSIILLLCAGLAGCGTVQRLNPFSTWQPETPLPYGANLNGDRRSPDFTVSVATRGAPIEAWRESARFPATRHCLRRFGSSVIDWRTDGGPEDWVVRYDSDGTAVVSGRCAAR